MLSGLVIAHAVDRPGRTLADYCQHRIARIGSVALPALMLSAAIAPCIGRDFTIYAVAPVWDATELWTGLTLNGGFIAQLWWLDRPPAFNAPFWSLNYEVWYYAIFGAWSYARPRWRWPAAAIACAAAGPKIVLLLPVWLLGVGIYRVEWRLRQQAALTLFLMTAVLGALYFWYDLGIVVRYWMAARWPGFISPLGGSNTFVGDFALGCILAAHFAAAAHLPGPLGFLLKLRAIARSVASFTFSTYLFHLPLLALIWGGLGLRSPFAVLPLLAIGIGVLGAATERQLPLFRRMLAALPIWHPVAAPPSR